MRRRAPFGVSVCLLVGFMLLLPAGPLCAQGSGQGPKARRILERPEYKGYRVETREYEGDGGARGNGEASNQPPSNSQPSDDTGYSEGETGWRKERGYRRSGEAGPSRRPQRPSGDGDASDSGGGSSAGLGWLGALFQVVFWVIVIVAALVAIFFIVKALMGIKLKRKPKAEKKKAGSRKKPGESTAAPADDELPALPQEFEDALVVAQREFDAALHARDWAKAALLAYRIFWLKAGWRGCVEQADVKTWRDALAMVRGSEMRVRVRELLPLVESVRYGQHIPGEREFEDWKRRLDQLEPRGVLS